MTVLEEVELKILQMMADGHTNAEIAKRLNYSTDGLKSKLHGYGRKLASGQYRIYKGLFDTMGARNRTHAVALAFRAGILRGDGDGQAEQRNAS